MSLLPGLHRCDPPSGGVDDTPSEPQVRAIWRQFAPHVRKERRKLVGGTAFGVVYAASRVAEPWPIKVVLDQVLYHKHAHGWWVPLFTLFGTSAQGMLLASGLWLGAAGAIRGLSYYFEDYLLSSAAQRIVYALRSRLYRHLHALSLSFHQQRRAGDTLVRLSSDIIMLRDVVVDSLVNLASGGVMLVLMVVVMALVDPVLTGVSLLVMPLVAAFTAVYGRRIRTSSRKQRKREGEVAAAMHEALSAMAVVQVHGAGEREQERFHDINRRSLKQGIKATRIEATMNRNVEIAIAGGLTAIVSVGTVRALHGSISPGELIVFISYLRAAYRPLQRASKTVQRSAKALAAAERVVEVLEAKPEVVDLPGAEAAPRFVGRIEFRGVDFAYAHGQPVLHDISFTARAGRTTAIVGATGCGKSTLLSLVPRLFEQSSGSVLVDGVDARTYTVESLRAQISIVLQESVLFGLSIGDNIRYGAPRASDEEVVAAAQAADIHDFVELLPEGYDTVLSERGASLSGGQRQRIAIARALVRKSPILLLDEPTSGLDAATQAEVVEALDALLEGRTTMLVTHDMRLVERADHIVVLAEGRVVAEGAHEDLLRRSSQYRNLIGAAPRRRVTARARARSETRAMFYSHNGVGVGHVQRQLDLATAYHARHPESAVLLATGSHGASMFSMPPGIDYLKLPSLQMTDRYRNWRPRELSLPIEAVTELRSELLRQTVRRFAPDLLVADFMPAGPYGELLPALGELERYGGAAVAGFRDIVDEPAFVRELWSETGVYDVLREHYAAICVYGDPATIDFVEGYGLDRELAGRTGYCGYLGRAPSSGSVTERRPFVLAASGGGIDGAATLEAFVGAAGILQPALGGTWRVVSGPLMPDRRHERLAQLGALAGVEVLRAVPDLRRQVGRADCVVAMCGYNTVCDVLSHRRPAIFVPRPGPSREQMLRADRLEEWGCASVVRDAELDPGRLAASIRVALASSPRAAPVSMDGLRQALDAFDAVARQALAA